MVKLAINLYSVNYFHILKISAILYPILSAVNVRCLQMTASDPKKCLQISQTVKVKSYYNLE